MMKKNRKWKVFAALGTLALLLSYPTASVIGGLATHGNDGFTANWADWLRNHHGTLVANRLESIYFKRHQPRRGGSPGALNAVPAVAGSNGHDGSELVNGVRPIVPPTSIPLVAEPQLPGEGVWNPTGPLVDGKPAMWVAQFRADALYTSELTSAVWFDPTRLHFTLVPGTIEPAGTWSHPPYVTALEQRRAVAAFNSGFRMQDARGGFYLNGKERDPLRDGAASFVLYRDGTVDVGTWGSDLHLSPDVIAVRQNLVLLVDHAKVNPTATYTDNKIWGNTPGSAIVEPRSGIGVTAQGGLVYVAGPALTARTLAESLQRAGCIRAMTLDMNPTWVTFNFLTHPYPESPRVLVGHKLYPQMKRGADRYLGAARPSTRDFYLVSAA